MLAVGLADIFAVRAHTEQDDPADEYRFDSFQNLRKFSEAVVITDLPTAGTVDAFMRVATRIQIVNSAQLAKMAGMYPEASYRAECASSSVQMLRAVQDLLYERNEVLRPIANRFRRRPSHDDTTEA